MLGGFLFARPWSCWGIGSIDNGTEALRAISSAAVRRLYISGQRTDFHSPPVPDVFASDCNREKTAGGELPFEFPKEGK
jgi:hypothetical protein